MNICPSRNQLVRGAKSKPEKVPHRCPIEMFTIIENGEVYSPALLGKKSVLLVDDKIGKIGDVDIRAVEALGVEYDVVDAKGCVVTPGFIDPHEHLLGGSGEEGFATQTPEITISEIVTAGITTVVGCLGADTTMKTLAGLLAKVKALKEEGLSAFMWTGGYTVPPTTITSSVRDDIMFIDEVIGAGEIAIADERSTEPTDLEVARLAHDAFIGGMLSKKAGRVHFHVGASEVRLQLLRDLIEKHDVRPDWLYPTHINRTDQLMREAIDLARQGCFVDIDTVDEDLPQKLRFYIENDGPPERLTLSSDASVSGPGNLYEQFRVCVADEKFNLGLILPMLTANTAEALKLPLMGKLNVGKMGDLLIMDKSSLEIREVFSSGKRLVKNGKLTVAEAFLKKSNRRIDLTGEKIKAAEKGGTKNRSAK